MRIKTQYNITGKVLVLPVQGSGSSDGNFSKLFRKNVKDEILKRRL